jgi:mono/diheme cytochrome c family protein
MVWDPKPGGCSVVRSLPYVSSLLFVLAAAAAGNPDAAPWTATPGAKAPPPPATKVQSPPPTETKPEISPAEMQPISDEYFKQSAAQPKTNAPAILNAQDIGDVRRGLNYAQRVCSECHNVGQSDAPSPNSKAPPFKHIANTPGMSGTALTAWSRTSHPFMPNLIIEPDDMDDLIAYILSLKDRK